MTNCKICGKELVNNKCDKCKKQYNSYGHEEIYSSPYSTFSSFSAFDSSFSSSSDSGSSFDSGGGDSGGGGCSGDW